MSKTIWYISKYANIQKYGANTRQASFCRKFIEKGFDVKLVTSNSSHLFNDLPRFKGMYLNEIDSGLNITWVNTIQYKNATSIRRIFSWVWFEFLVLLLPFTKNFKKPDIVIVSSLSLLTIFSGLFYKLFFKSKFILEIRDIWPLTLIDLKKVSKRHPFIVFLKIIEKLGYKYSDSIVGTMPGLALHVTKIIGVNNKVHFIPQGVDLNFYDKKQKTMSFEYFKKYFPKNKFIITYAGTLGVANALEYIVEAARILESINTNIHFVIIGSGPEEDKLKQQANALSNITFTPRIQKEQVHAVLTKSDLLVASVRHEKVYDFGISLNKFVDYMFAKKPIVCMFSGYPSMLNEAGCGDFTPSENSKEFAECLLKYERMSNEDIIKLGENGYNFLVEKRSFNVLSSQYLELIND